MASKQKSTPIPEKIRELSEKDLNKITKAVGKLVRAQTIDQKKKMKASLRQELDAARTAFFSHGKKGA